MQSKLTRRDLVHLLAEAYELLDEMQFQDFGSTTGIDLKELVRMMNDNTQEWESIKDDVEPEKVQITVTMGQLTAFADAVTEQNHGQGHYLSMLPMLNAELVEVIDDDHIVIMVNAIEIENWQD